MLEGDIYFYSKIKINLNGTNWTPTFTGVPGRKQVRNVLPKTTRILNKSPS